MGLRLTPADPARSFWAKCWGNAIAMLILAALILPVLVVFLNVEIAPALRV